MNIRLLILLLTGIAGAVVATILIKKSSHPVARYRVAIIVPTVHGALEEIEHGFKQTLSEQLSMSNPSVDNPSVGDCSVDTCSAESCSVAYDVYNAQGDRALLRQQVEQVVDAQYDLICTIATQPSLLVKELLTKRGYNTPVIACAVDDPLGIELVKSFESSGNMIVAVTSHDDMRTQMQVFCTVKPNMKKIMLVYHPANAMQKYAQQVATIANEKGIELTTVQIMATNELMAKVSPLISGHDAVVVLTDNVVVSGIETLVNLCNRSGVTLCASDLNSGYTGAAVAYGVTEASYGIVGAQLAQQILVEKKNPTNIPSQVVNDFSLLINKRTMQQQGLVLDGELIEKLRTQFKVVLYGAA